MLFQLLRIRVTHYFGVFACISLLLDSVHALSVLFVSITVPHPFFLAWRSVNGQNF